MTSSFRTTPGVPGAAVVPPTVHQASWKAGLPPEYVAVESYVTQGGTMAPATELLCPLLLTSGLPRGTLAHLWELANRGSPGQLSISELHCLLAMVALAQRGQPLKLLEDGRYPVPQLNLAHFSIPLPQTGSSPSFPNLTPGGNTTSPPADDFDDFKSAEGEADDFCDFQQALPTPASSDTHLTSSTLFSSSTLSTPLPDSSSLSDIQLPSKDLLPRSLINTTPTEFTWGTQLAPKPLGAATSLPHLPTAQFNLLSDPHLKPTTTTSKCSAEEKPPPMLFLEPKDAQGTKEESRSDILQPMSANEDKYSCFRNLEVVSNISSWSVASREEKKEEDDDFGDFVAALPTTPSSSQGKGDQQDYFLAGSPVYDRPARPLLVQQECQSVSSLELDLPALVPDEEPSPQEPPLTLDAKLAYTLEVLNFGSPDSPAATTESPPHISLQEPAAPPTVEPAPSGGALGGKVPVDRYSCIREEVECVQPQLEDEGPYIWEWTRCLESCQRLIEEATDVLGMVSNPEVCREVLTSEQGSRYLTDLTEVYRVAERITKADAYGKTSPKIRQLSQAIRKSWGDLNSLTQELDITLKACHTEEYDGGEASTLCGVCLLPVKDRLLWFGGRKYHAGCANLWVNCVEPILPSLRPPTHLST